jgi:hypothetical protein
MKISYDMSMTCSAYFHKLLPSSTDFSGTKNLNVANAKLYTVSKNKGEKSSN